MDYGKFMANLRQNGARSAYILAAGEHGLEPYFIEKAERALIDALVPGEAERQESVQRIDSDVDTKSLIGLIDTVPFFTQRTVTIIKNSRLFASKKENAADDEPASSKAKTKKPPADKSAEKLNELLLNMPETSAVIFEMSAKADKRKKIVKELDKLGCVLEADIVRPWNIGEWLRGELAELGRTLDCEANEYFMAAVSMMSPISLSFLDREFKKLAMYTDAKKFTRADMEAAFSSMPEVSGFAMLDAISAKDVRTSITILERQMHDGVYLPLIVANITRHVRQLIEASALMARGISGRALGQPMGLNPFIAEKIGRAAKNFDIGRLRAALIALADADYLLKTGGSDNAILEHIVIELCRK